MVMILCVHHDCSSPSSLSSIFIFVIQMCFKTVVKKCRCGPACSLCRVESALGTLGVFVTLACATPAPTAAPPPLLLCALLGASSCSIWKCHFEHQFRHKLLAFTNCSLRSVSHGPQLQAVSQAAARAASARISMANFSCPYFLRSHRTESVFPCHG